MSKEKGKIIVSTLGRNGRFGNQIFQYAFLRICAKHYDLDIETSPWIGQYLFGHHDPEVMAPLPLVKEEEICLSSEFLSTNTTTLLRNVDLYGFFQYHTSFYRHYKDFFCSLFEPTSEAKNFLEPGISLLRNKGKTVVGIHLRRGDYGPPPFYSTPSSWYKDYLDGLWQTLDNPVLFIASDEPLKVVKDFSEYGPITSNDLGIKLPEAEFYPDFYILSQCDVLLISNSSFSFAASMLNHHSRTFVRPHFKAGKLVPFDPWDSQPFMYFDVGPLGIYNILRWIKSGMKNSIVRIIQGVLLKVIGKENLERALEKDSGKQCT